LGVLVGIKAAQKAGISWIKLNSVIVRDLNDDEVSPLLDFALEKGFRCPLD
jgi:cyclic pyranopterin phosphate synthase